MTHMTHMTHCYNPTRMRAHARTRTRDRPSRCVICVMTPPAWVGGYPRTVGHRLVGPSSFRQIGGMRVLNVDTLLVLEYALRVPPVMGPRALRALRHRGVDQAKRRRARRGMKSLFGWLASSVLRLAQRVGAIAGGWSQESARRKRQRGAELSETASTLARMTHSHTMQEPLPDRATPVSALIPADECKEMTMTDALHGIIVGFASQP